jgi:hypothetical protein
MKESNTNRIFNQDNLWQSSTTAPPIACESIREEVLSAELSQYIYKHPDACLYPSRDRHQ